MELRIKQLIKRLNFLGYCNFEIKAILQDAIVSKDLDTNIHQCAGIISALEKYEKLGLHYLNCYSK